MITFALFVWFTMKFVWPVLEKTLKERQEKIAEGLMAAERGHKDLEIAQKNAVKQLREAHEQANHIIDQATKQATFIVEEAKKEAQLEREKILRAGKMEVEQERRDARSSLQGEVVNLVVKTTEKLLKRTLNDSDQTALLDLKSSIHD